MTPRERRRAQYRRMIGLMTRLLHDIGEYDDVAYRDACVQDLRNTWQVWLDMREEDGDTEQDLVLIRTALSLAPHHETLVVITSAFLRMLPSDV